MENNGMMNAFRKKNLADTSKFSLTKCLIVHENGSVFSKIKHAWLPSVKFNCVRLVIASATFLVQFITYLSFFLSSDQYYIYRTMKSFSLFLILKIRVNLSLILRYQLLYMELLTLLECLEYVRVECLSYQWPEIICL